MTDEYPKLALVRQVVEEYGNETALFEYLKQQGRFSKKELRLLRSISRLATEEFKGIRRYSGKPYVTHLYSVCAIGAVYCGALDDSDLLKAALLHDITEEFPRLWPYHRVETYSTKRVAELVHTCSIDRNWPYYNDNKEEYLKSYFEKIGRSSEATSLKLWDRIHNQLTLIACSTERQYRKNRETERYVLPLAIKHSVLAEELEESIRETRSRLALIAMP